MTETRWATSRRGPNGPKEMCDRNRLSRHPLKARFLHHWNQYVSSRACKRGREESGRRAPLRGCKKPVRTTIKQQRRAAGPIIAFNLTHSTLLQLASFSSSYTSRAPASIWPTRKREETLWLGVEPRLPAIKQMFSIKLTSKCTNRYTTKDW
jgi:hypothetical protein